MRVDRVGARCAEAAFDLQGLMTQGFRVLVDDRSFLDRPGRGEEIARRLMKGWS